MRRTTLRFFSRAASHPHPFLQSDEELPSFSQAYKPGTVKRIEFYHDLVKVLNKKHPQGSIGPEDLKDATQEIMEQNGLQHTTKMHERFASEFLKAMRESKDDECKSVVARIVQARDMSRRGGRSSSGAARATQSSDEEAQAVSVPEHAYTQLGDVMEEAKERRAAYEVKAERFKQLQEAHEEEEKAFKAELRTELKEVLRLEAEAKDREEEINRAALHSATRQQQEDTRKRAAEAAKRRRSGGEGGGGGECVVFDQFLRTHSLTIASSRRRRRLGRSRIRARGGDAVLLPGFEHLPREAAGVHDRGGHDHGGHEGGEERAPHVQGGKGHLRRLREDLREAAALWRVHDGGGVRKGEVQLTSSSAPADLKLTSLRPTGAFGEGAPLVWGEAQGPRPAVA